MLRITVELVPGGREEDAKVIGRGSIANISNLASLSDYVCAFEENAWKGKAYGPYRGDVKGWPRTERGAWEIVHAALAKALKPRKPRTAADG